MATADPAAVEASRSGLTPPEQRARLFETIFAWIEGCARLRPTIIVLEGSLAFLGLSIGLPTASLGNIINEGVQNNLLSINPYIALWPSIYIFLLLVALNLMADRLRGRFDVRAGNL